jgi:tetratricopeptide (TPR) repeat protein
VTMGIDEIVTSVADTVLVDATRSGERSVIPTLDTGRSGRPATLEVGALVNGRYAIDAHLGTGGMGVVYRARDTLHDHRLVALKTIRADGARRARISMFKAEFRMMAELRHPHVAEVYDFEPVHGCDDLYLFTMEYVPGQDAFEATEGAPLSRVIDLIVQACRALSYVHSRQIVHFDLKPSNVLVGDDRRVKVVDFGVAGAAREDRGGLRGTPHYMAPELTAESTQIDHRADLYALGIMAYELLLRRLPFEGRTLLELVHAHHSCELPLDEGDLPGWLASVLRRLCAKEPDQRFRSANDVIAAINAGGGFAHELETKETRESYVVSSRFVGRATERDRLWAFVRARAQSPPGEGPMMLVAGQSGVGKSRLVRELRRLCQLHRLPFIEADCHEAGGDLEPVARALSFAVPLADSTGRGDLVVRHGAQLVKLVPELFPEQQPAVHPEPERERLAMTRGVASFFTDLAADTPIVLYLNDLQWAGKGTIEVVEAMMGLRSQRAPRLALVGTFRSDEVDGRPLEALLGEDHSVLRLEPLTREEVGAVVVSMLGVDELPDAFVDLVAEATGGNPFFVEELMRALIEHGHVFIDEGAWAADTSIETLPIPERIDEVFLRRLRLVGDDGRRLLELLATHGKPLEAEVLEAACGMNAERFFVAITRMRERSMIRAVTTSDTTFTIAHDRMREAVDRETSPEQRGLLHGELAEAIEATRPLAGDHLLDAAGHWLEARIDTAPPERRAHVARILRKAARQSRVATLYETSLRQLEAALALGADGLDEGEMAGLSAEALAVAYLIDHDAAERRFEGLLASDLAPPVQAEIMAARGLALIVRSEYDAAYDGAVDAIAALGYRLPRRPGRFRTLVELLRARWSFRSLTPEAIASLPEAYDPRFRAAISIMESGGMAISFVNATATLAMAAIFVRLFRHHGVTADVCSPLMAFAMAHVMVGDYRRAFELARAIEGLGDRFGNPDRVTGVRGWVASFVAVWRVPLPEVLVMIRRSYDLTIEAGQLQLAQNVANVELTVHFWQSPDAAAWLELAREHESLLASLGHAHAIAEVGAIERLIRDLSGAPRQLHHFDRQLFESYETLIAIVDDDPIASSLVLCCKSLSLALEGRWAEAATAAEKGMERAALAPIRQVFNAYLELSFFVTSTRAGRARWPHLGLRRSLWRFGRLAESCPETFSAAHALMQAELARVRGRNDEAVAAYERAVEAAREGGLFINAALALELAAAFHCDRGQVDEARRARQEARELHAAWGAHRMVARLDAELADIAPSESA